MDNKDNLVHVYTGSHYEKTLLKEVLEDNKIAAIIKDDFNLGLAAEFSSNLTLVDLYIKIAGEEKSGS